MSTNSLKLPTSGERCSNWEVARVAVLGVNLSWTTLCLGGYLERTLVVTSVLNAALFLVHTLGVLAERMRAEKGGVELPRTHAAGWILLPFLGYAAVNAAWISPVSWLGWMDWLNWAQATLVFWVVLNGIRSSNAHRALILVLAALACVLVGLACYQRFAAPTWLMLDRTQVPQFIGRASGSFGQPNSLASFLVLVGPIFGAQIFARRSTAISRTGWGYVTALCAFALVLTISRGAWLALATSMLITPLIWVRGGAMRKGAIVLSLALVLATTGWVLMKTVPSIRDRLAELKTNRGELSRPILWRAAWKIFESRPLTGTGAGSFGVMLDGHRPENFQLEARWAHNDYLNTLSDCGAIGLLLCFGGWAVIALGCARAKGSGNQSVSDRSQNVGLWIGITAFSLQLLVDSNLKTPALAMTFAAVAGLLVQRQWPGVAVRSDVSKIRLSSLTAAGALAVLAALVLWIVPIYRGEALRQEARVAIDRQARKHGSITEAVLRDSTAGLKSAAENSPANGRVWSDLSYATGLLSRFDRETVGERGKEAEVFARRAIERGACVSEFWVRLAVALDLQGRWMEAGSAVAESIRLAPARATVWYHQAFHLSLHPAHLREALAAVTLSLRLDPANPEAHALREQLAERSRAP